MSRNARFVWLWCLPLLLVTTYIAAAQLAADLIWFDEYWSIYNSGGIDGPLDVGGVWARTYSTDPGGMGVFYHWLLNVWQGAIGNTAFSVRAFSLLWGVLTLVALYRFGMQLYSQRVGLLAAAIMAGSALYLDYWHEARAYTLITFLSVAAMLSYDMVITARAGRGRWLVALVLALTGLAYTHYVALVMGAVIGVSHLLRFERSRRWWGVLLALASVLLWMLPWFSFILSVIQLGMEDVTRQVLAMDGAAVLREYAHAFTNANIAFAALLLFYALRRPRATDALIWGWWLIPLLLVLIVNALLPFMIHIRYLLLTLPALALLLALGMVRLRTVPAMLLLTIWFGAGLYQMAATSFIDDLTGQTRRIAAPDFERALDVLAARADSDDRVLLRLTRPNFAFLFEDTVFSYYFQTSGRLPAPLTYDLFDTINDDRSGERDAYLNDVLAYLDNAPLVWTLVDPPLPADWRADVVDFALRSRFTVCETTLDAPRLRLTLYSQPRATYDTTLGDGLIQIANLEPDALTDDHLRLTLGLWLADVPSDTYSLGLHITDAAGNLVQQVDSGLANQRPYACISEMLPLTDLTAGTYTVRALVYDWQTGERLLSAEGDDHVVLTHFELKD